MRFLLPPSLGPEAASERAARLQAALRERLGDGALVRVAPGYDALAKDLLAGRVDAAWAPPFVCARVESLGAKVAVRGVRDGAATYRAALVCREDRPVGLGELDGKRVAWVDRDSTSGYLLPMALLKARGVDPAKTFFQQLFTGSYRAALEAVAEGRADLASVFAPSARPGREGETGVAQVVPELASRFSLVAFTDDAPNDGVCVSPAGSPEIAAEVERFLLSLHESEAGTRLLGDVFNLERFEPAPKMAYRALYRVALATL
jgi:phosphonate transport system substrate-binding protein